MRYYFLQKTFIYFIYALIHLCSLRKCIGRNLLHNFIHLYSVFYRQLLYFIENRVCLTCALMFIFVNKQMVEQKKVTDLSLPNYNQLIISLIMLLMRSFWFSDLSLMEVFMSGFSVSLCLDYCVCSCVLIIVCVLVS